MYKIKKVVALYVRVSTQEQATEGYSVGAQTERLRLYCKSQDWTIFKIYTDPGYSGGSADRPGLKDLIKDVEEHKVDKVVVYKLDRLSRSQKDTLYLIEDVFLNNNVDFVSMTENFDTSTPFGRAMIGILSVFAQLEREQIKERMNLGKEARAKEGKWHGGSTEPIGYDYDPATNQLIVNDYEKMQIQEIIDLFLSGTPLRTIETMFIDKGYKQKHGLWTPKTMRRVLANRIYLGENKYRDKYYPGTHEPIIDVETFERVNELLRERREEYLKLGLRPGIKKSILGGYLFCERCGAKYTRQRGGSPKYGIIYYYACYSRNKKVKAMVKDPNCKNTNYKAEELDSVVLAEIRKLALDPNYFYEIKKDAGTESKPDNRQIIKNEIVKIDNQISKLMDLYALGNMPINVIENKINTLTEDRNKLEAEYNSISEPNIMSVEEVTEIVSNLDDILEEGSLEEIRELIGSLIHHIGIDGDKITIYWKFN